MKGIIIYAGRYGATRQYAHWLGAETGLPVLDAKDANANRLSAFDFFVLGSSIYIGKLQIFGWVKKHKESLQAKKLFVFLVGGTSLSKDDKWLTYYHPGVPADLREKATLFCLEGRLQKNKLSWWDRFLLKAGAFLSKDPNMKKGFKDYDHVTKEQLLPLISAIKNFRENSSVYIPASQPELCD
jgi:menaquinone-dependent protoporphyrinogen IX oxidase